MTEMATRTPARNYVDGEWRDAATDETYEKRSPWRPDEVTGVFQASGADDANAAVAAAADAAPAWAALPAPARGAFLAKAADAIEARVERVAQDMTAEMGKPLREARMEAARGAAILRFAAGEAWRPIGEVYDASVPNQRLYTVRRPLGVVGLITPWNFPIAIPVWKLAPALIHGNAVVLKLAYEAPRTGLHVAEAFAEAGLPPGVLNVLTGPGSKVGAALVESPAVRALSFTGSVAVGHQVRADATARGCRVQLELGGHNPFVVARRRRARPRGRGRLRRRLLVGRAEVHRDAPDPRAGGRLRRLPREAARAGRGREGRRSRRSGDRGGAGRHRDGLRRDPGARSSEARVRGRHGRRGRRAGGRRGLPDRPHRLRGRRRRPRCSPARRSSAP